MSTRFIKAMEGGSIGVLLVYPKVLFDIIGIGLFALVIVMQLLKKPLLGSTA